MNECTKNRFEFVVTSYGRNMNLDNGIKNQEKANNSSSYRYAAINHAIKSQPESKKLSIKAIA